MSNAAESFHALLQHSLLHGALVKATLSRPEKSAPPGLRNIHLRPVEIRGTPLIAWTWRYDRRDEVKNLTAAETASRLLELCGPVFRNAVLFTADTEATLSHNRRGEPAFHQHRLNTASAAATPAAHDREKSRLLDPAAPWLCALGITSPRGEVLPSAQAKWRQINKFVEILAGLIRSTSLPEQPAIADMGCGKGYLTFALYDYLVTHTTLRPRVTGIELRPELTAAANRTAAAAGFSGLQFTPGTIDSWQAAPLDVLIALHACDTATDDALAAGVRAGAQLLVVSPCCHKEVRRHIDPQPLLHPLMRHGILAERQSELLTDALRALMLEQHGYRTSVFEFISTEHTARNLMLTAVRARPRHRAAEEIAALKTLFGLSEQRLETLLSAHSPPAETN